MIAVLCCASADTIAIGSSGRAWRGSRGSSICVRSGGPACGTFLMVFGGGPVRDNAFAAIWDIPLGFGRPAETAGSFCDWAFGKMPGSRPPTFSAEEFFHFSKRSWRWVSTCIWAARVLSCSAIIELVTRTFGVAFFGEA